MAFLLPLLMALLFGIWEVGRYWNAVLVLEGAAREGARHAAAGSRTDPVTGDATLIYAYATPPHSPHPDVETIVKNYLARNGFNTANATVTFENLDPSAAVTPYTNKSDPYKANRLDELKVTVTLPYQDIRWSATSMFMNSSTMMTVTITANSMRDDPFTVNSTIPNN
jgi:Flp pilus assembly protein TadG